MQYNIAYVSFSALKTFLAITTETSIMGIDVDANNTVEAIPRVGKGYYNGVEFIYEENALLVRRKNQHSITILRNISSVVQGKEA